MSITPGPNNLMCLFLGAKFGLRGIKNFVCTSMLVLFLKSLLCGFLNVVLAQKIPVVVPYLKWVGAAYMLYLAYSIFKSGISNEQLVKGESGDASAKSGLLLQTLNIKSWIAALSIFSVYVIPYTTSAFAIVGASFAFFFLASVASVIWCCCGAAIHKIYDNHKLPICIILALSLAVCAVTAVL